MVFTHGGVLGKTKAERYEQMVVRLSDPRTEVFSKLKGLMGMIESQ